ncbi:hypothetical protein Tco_1047499 [Tanacetum coccineum]
MSQHSNISGSAYPEYPLSQHRYPACPALGLQSWSIPNLFRGGSVISGMSVLWSEDSNCKGGDEVGSGNGVKLVDCLKWGRWLCGNRGYSGRKWWCGGVVGKMSSNLFLRRKVICWLIPDRISWL